jgi:DNA (cytosine-5)-methyltransferase 1
MEKKLISIKETARMLGVSTLTLRNWDKNGKLRALRHPMNNYRVYNKEVIDKLIDDINNDRIPRIGSIKKIKKLNVLHLDN